MSSHIGLLLLCFCFSLSIAYRPINGSGFNPFHPEWGTVNQPLMRKSPALYSDDIQSPRMAVHGGSLPSARYISDVVFAHPDQTTLPLSHRGYTDYLTFWGQFLDHDITFTSGDPGANREPPVSYNIPVPQDDLFFDPEGLGNVTIPFNRGIIYAGTGTSSFLPALPYNKVTSWFDSSQVYGSTDEVADYLRSHVNGTLKENPNRPGFPPFNDDPNTPVQMQTIPGIPQSSLFLFGDVRGNINPGLCSLQILFFREHNRRARILAEKNFGIPTWDDEKIYQEARKMVIAIMHHITEEEYMPTTLGEHLPEYTEWQPNVSPAVMVDFSTGAFRYGHSEVNSHFLLTGAGKPDGRVSVRDSFFNTSLVLENFDQLIAGMFTQVQGAVDVYFVDDLRNFLFGPPGNGGVDLTSINTQRGRDHGLPGFNTFRAYFGLYPYEDFDDINPDKTITDNLEKVYNDIDDCDVYVCGLAEPPVHSLANVGETFYTVIKEQYLRIRDADNQWYETPGWLDPDQLKEARETFLADVIAHNTILDPNTIQCHVFGSPDGCGSPIPPPPDENGYDFIVTMVRNNDTGPVDSLENTFVLAIDGVPQESIALEYGTYTFFAQISCNEAFLITAELDDTAPESINGQYACLHQTPVLTLKIDEDSPDILYYDSGLHPSMGGNITVIRPTPPEPTPTPNQEAGYSSTVVIGISVGLAIAGVLLIVSFVFFCRSKSGYSSLK